jgi:hypothetical protein
MRLEHRAAAGSIGLGLANYVILVITSQHEPALTMLPVLYKAQTVKGTGTSIDNIAGHNNLIGLPLFQVGRHCLQGHKIAVNIGQNR